MLIPLVHGEPIRFGAEDEKGVVMGTDGQLRIVDVADVGENAILVHDEHARRPGPGVRAVPAEPRPDDAHAVRRVPRRRPARVRAETSRQLMVASEKGPGDLGRLLASGGTWEVN